MKKIIFYLLLLLSFTSYAQDTIPVKVGYTEVEVEIENQDELDVFIIVDEMPVFREGEGINGFREYIFKNIKYSSACEDFSSTVVVRFTIDTIGQLIDLKIVRSACESVDQEVLKVFSNSPRWDKCGMQGGRKVKVQMMMPIRITFQ